MCLYVVVQCKYDHGTVTNPYQSQAMQASSLLWREFADEVLWSAAPNQKYHDARWCFVLCVPFKRVHVSPRHSLRAGGVALMLMPGRIWGCFDSINGQRKKIQKTQIYKYILSTGTKADVVWA